jgi:hypothetical protein
MDYLELNLNAIRTVKACVFLIYRPKSLEAGKKAYSLKGPPQGLALISRD